MKLIRIISLILLSMSIFVTVDLLLNFLSANIPSINDGIMCRSVFKPFFGEQWSLEGFYHVFATSLWVTTAIVIENVVLAILMIVTNGSDKKA